MRVGDLGFRVPANTTVLLLRTHKEPLIVRKSLIV